MKRKSGKGYEISQAEKQARTHHLFKKLQTGSRIDKKKPSKIASSHRGAQQRQGVSDVIGLSKMKVKMDKEEMHRNNAMRKIEKGEFVAIVC